MFPYFETTGWHLGGLEVHPFVPLVAVALATGYMVATRRAERSGIGREHFSQLGLFVIAAALVGGHLAKFFYEPDSFHSVVEHPSLIFQLANGQASFGAFMGGYLAALAFLRWRAVPYRDWYLYADAACFAVPFSWWIGRVGCYLVHDHPGVLTSSFLGVRYPGGTRYDLGLLEALFLLALALLFACLDRKTRPRGFYYVLFLFSYGLFRYLLDSLHVDPPRYGGWSVDRIAGAAMMLGAGTSILELRRLRKTRNFSKT